MVFSRSSTVQIPRLWRLLLLSAGVLLAGVLVTSRVLSPDPDGIGTHQQLGLPPCTFQFLWGMRCPSCGMTTSWAHFVRGQLVASMGANAGGAFLALVAVITCPWLILSGIRGRWFALEPRVEIALGIMMAIVAITLADWALRCFVP